MFHVKHCRCSGIETNIIPFFTFKIVKKSDTYKNKIKSKKIPEKGTPEYSDFGMWITTCWG